MNHPMVWAMAMNGAIRRATAALIDVLLPRFAAMINSLDLFPIGASWGGYESLLLPSYPGKVRTAVPWPFKGYTIRLHIGLENPDDLIADLEKGFRHLMSC